MTLKFFFKKCKSCDVAYLQLRVEFTLELSVFELVFHILSFLNNFCEIMHFQKGEDWSPESLPLAAPVTSLESLFI